MPAFTKLDAQCNIVSTVPYLEDFQSLTANNQLPNCGWAASNLSVTCSTFTGSSAGAAAAYFYYTPSGTNFFYTNGIQLNAGVVYSVSIWYMTDFTGSTNWTDLSILVGPNQSALGAFTVATTNGPALSSAYIPLTATFTVATSGIHYVAVRGTSNGQSGSFYLLWDNLEITAPCTGICASNSPTVTISPASASVCVGGIVQSFTATGADTYSWSTGATGSVTPPTFTTSSLFVPFSVVGTNALSGCEGTFTANLVLNPSPIISLIANSSQVCLGNSTTLTAFGANTYSWSNGANTAMNVVTPSVSTTYSVTGYNNYGCSGGASQQITVTPLPVISASSSATSICSGESAILSATDTPLYWYLDFQWITDQGIAIGEQVTVSPNVSTTYTLVGADVEDNGCPNKLVLNLIVNACTGLNKTGSNNQIKAYPNPFSEELTIELNTKTNRVISLYDLTGRIVLNIPTKNDQFKINTTGLPKGFYLIKIEMDGTSKMIKVVKE